MDENIWVNEPGPEDEPDAGGGAGGGGAGGGGTAGNVAAGGAEGGVAGALLPAGPAGIDENMRVNSPAACEGGGGAENDGAGVSGEGAGGTENGGAGADGAGGFQAGGSAAGLGLEELKMRVNSPGAEAEGGAGAGGAAEAGALMDWNICVKLPGWLLPEEDGGVTTVVGLDSTGGSMEGDGEIFSLGTGVKRLANSSEGRTGGGASGSGVRRACSMRVKSPCAAAAPGGGAGAGTGSGAGAGAAAAGGGAAKGARGWAAAGDGAAAGGAACLPSSASRSSSSREGGVGTELKMPVALDGDPPGGSSDWGAWSLPRRSLRAFMWVHQVC